MSNAGPNVPLPPATRHLISAAPLAKTKTGAQVINTPCGTIVDEAPRGIEWVETRIKMTAMTIENVVAPFAAQRPPNLRNPEALAIVK